MPEARRLIPFLLMLLLVPACFVPAHAEDILRFELDVTQPVIELPAVFWPNVDLSGRGLHNDITWPQTAAAKEVLETWQQDIGFKGIYRLQYNLWEISRLRKAPYLQRRLLENYESIIKAVSDAGGTVILNIYGTPAGMGRVLDVRSVPENLRAYKALIKEIIRELSCRKRYTVWYEFWNAPDLEDFFLGRKQDYFHLYRTVAQAVKELRKETGISIPLGAPAISSWFQNYGANTIVTPERSLIYELIKFCYRYRLPLDFITWHAYTTDDRAEEELSRYKKKSSVTLIREWLSYFNFNKEIPLIIDEWTYDRGANILSERGERSFVTASFIPSRMQNMYRSGITHQLYFCLEDFQDNREGVSRNMGIFYVSPGGMAYRGGPKAVYNLFRMLSRLGDRMYPPGEGMLRDRFIGVIPTRGTDEISLLVYNYIDPDIAVNYLSRHIATVRGAERKILLRLIRSGRLQEVLRGEREVTVLRLTRRLRVLVNEAISLHERALAAKHTARTVKIALTNLEGTYLYQRYRISSACGLDCAFTPVEEKAMALAGDYREDLTVEPYSVHLIVLHKKEKETVPVDEE